MKGLELSKRYFEEFGKPMLERDFADKMDRLAVGLVGHGSECFGFDDSISLDHDYEAGFCIWLDKKDEEQFGFKLFRAYSKLPKEYNGIKMQKKTSFGSPYKGVHTIDEFYSFYLGENFPKTNREWLAIPDFYLAEATNGEVFFDNLGEFTRIRNYIKDRPQDVRLKKLASSLFYMAQAGQYNYKRCFLHGEKLASSMALNSFVDNCANAVFLINDRFAPYYKWKFRALKGLEKLSCVYDRLLELQSEPYNFDKNIVIIEDISSKIRLELINCGLTQDMGDYLEAYANAVNNKIRDGELRNMPIML